MSQPQSAILASLPVSGRFLVFGLKPSTDVRPALNRLRDVRVNDATTIGFGQPLVQALTKSIAHLRPFPAMSGPGCAIPSTQGAVWAFVGGSDAGELIHRAVALVELLGDGFRIDEDVVAFQHGGGRDLSGYEDGTENPSGDKATAAAIVAGQGDGLDGSSFVAAQRWVHDLSLLDRMAPSARDHVIGRSRKTNEELADAPLSAHVKRAAQESFDPPAFMVRRSMPWGSVKEHGLYFVAYGTSLDAYERVLARMVGRDDGVVDALFSFSHAVSGGYYWCPPARDDRLDLRALGI